MKKVKLKEVLEQKKNAFKIKDSEEYKQVTVSKTGEIKLRTIKKGAEIGTKKQYKIKPGWFIYSRLGIHNGAFGIVPKKLDNAIVTGDMPVFEINKEKILPEILIMLLKQRRIKNIFDDLTRGLAQSRIREKYLLEIEIPLPSPKEQKQILDKINSMKNEITQLETNISHDKKLLTKLKQAILQEAVQGKLVKQDPKDEPASKLLKKIKKEKEKMIKEGKMRKKKSLPEISEDEVPYELPEGWVWTRLGEICENISAGGDKPKDFVKEKTKKCNVPVIANGETNKGIIGYTKEAKIFEKSITVSGRGTIGYSCIRNFPYTPIVRLIVLIPSKNIDINFLNYVLSATLEVGLGTSIPQLTIPMIKPKLIALPPLAEQKRIVEKVDSLMKFCDELEEKIKKNKKNSERLMGAVLKGVFSE